MLQRVDTPETAQADIVAALVPHLRADNEILRTAAIRALGAQAPGDPRVRAALLDALQDPDPDLRTDAMAALAGVAGAADAPAILRSLTDDPVREVKLAAIDLLAALGDRTAWPLLRALAVGRCDDRVAWEDDGAVWEDWLDIQTAAIDALGRMGCVAAIPDLLAAHADEFGQTLDAQVFAALARLGPDGAGALLAFAGQGGPLTRKRALGALAGVDAGALLAHLDRLLGDPSPQVRALALPLLAAGDDRAADIARGDPDAGLRAAAVRRFAPGRASLALSALLDADQGVQAAGLDHLHLPLPGDAQGAVLDNVLAWLGAGGPDLAVAAARRLPALAPDRAEGPLTALAVDGARPLQARIAAVGAIAALNADAAGLIALLSSPAQQVRMVALTALRARAGQGDAAARLALAAAIAGTLLTAQDAVAPHAPEAGADLGAPRHDGAAPRVRISADGDIIEDPAPAAPGASTLGSIQDAPPPPAAEDTPEESGAKTRKRRAVEGPEAVADDLARVAMGIVADLGDAAIDAAVDARLGAGDDALRGAAWAAVARRAPSPVHLDDAARGAMADPAPAVRMAALGVLTASGAGADALIAALGDEDALIRAAALRAGAETATDALLRHLADPAGPVREAAAQALLAGGHDAAPQIVRALLAACRADTLGHVVRASPAARDQACAHLGDGALEKRALLVLLEALAAGRPAMG